MAHSHGAHLGGVRTVQDLLLRSRVDSITGCWHWGLSSSQGAPRVHLVTPDTGRSIVARGRRAALYLARGRDLPAGHVAFARLCCQAEDCVNPEHARSGTRQQHGEWMRATGATAGLPGKRAAALKAWDKRGRKITPEQVAHIRSSRASTYALARELGLSQYAVWSVRVNQCHRQHLPGASAFHWRPGATARGTQGATP